MAIQSSFPVDHRAQAKRRSRLKTYKVAHWIHSLIGLKLSLIFSLVLVTGTIAVFAEEIDWLLYSEIRVTPQEQKMNEGEILERLTEAMPGVGISGFTTSSDRERSAAFATLSPPGGGFQKVWVDPYTGEVKGVTPFLTVGEFLSILHKNLFMPLIGRALVNVFGVLCLIGLVSGLFTYRRFWKHFFSWPRLGQGSRVFLSDLHKLIGLWGLWFVLIIGVTGSWWFYHNPLVFYKLAPQILPAKTIDPQLSREDLNKLHAGIPTPLSSAVIVDAVKKENPNFDVIMLQPPEHSGMAYVVRGTQHDLLTSKWSSAYYVNPYTAEIIGHRLTSEMTPLQRFDNAMVPLHYGTFGYSGTADLTVKTIWFVFGLGMSILSISGMVIYYQRTKVASRKLIATTPWKRASVKSWRILRPWGGPMSALKYLNWGFILVIGIGINIGFQLQKEGTSGSGYQYAEQSVGNWNISLNATLGLLEKDLDPIRAGRTTNINAFIKSGDPAAIKFMYVKVKKPRTTRAPGAVIHGSIGNQHAHMPVPKKLKEGDELWLTIEDWYGNFYQTSWSLMPDGYQTIDLRKQP